MELRYAAARGLRLREFDDGVVVFDPRSWDAHLLNPAAAAVLDICIAEPASARDIEVFLADALTGDSRADAAEHAARVLGELSQLGLIETVCS